MRQYLHHDEASGELRLVLEDLYRGQHERTEFRVIDDSGATVRRGQQFDGMDAERDSLGGWHTYTSADRFIARRVSFQVEQRATAETRTQCRRLASKSGRARCDLCQAARP